MTDSNQVACRGCGTLVSQNEADPKSVALCPRCGLPVSWSRDVAQIAQTDEDEREFGRLPYDTSRRVRTKICRNPLCGELTPPDSIYCLRCGQPLDREHTARCQCEALIAPGSNYCSHCGRSFRPDEPGDSAPEFEAEQAQVVYEVSSEHWWALLFFAAAAVVFIVVGLIT